VSRIEIQVVVGFSRVLEGRKQ